MLVKLKVVDGSASLTEAREWATKLNAKVVDVDYSSKEWAVGTTVPDGSSKDWAVTPEDTLVNDTEYSAYHWAKKAEQSAGIPGIPLGGAGRLLVVNQAETERIDVPLQNGTNTSVTVNDTEIQIDISDAGLNSIAGLTTDVDTMIYTTALDTYAVTPLTAFARTLLDDADINEFLNTLSFNELVDDRVNLLIVAGVGIIKTYDDVSNTLTLDVDVGSDWTGTLDGQEGAWYLDRTNHTGTQLAATISDFSEAVDDRVSALLVEGNDVTITYDDNLNTLTIDVVATLNIDELLDVIITDVADGEVLRFDGVNWINNTLAEANIATASRQILVSGLATGGGDLTSDRTIDVPIASQAEAEAGAIDDKAMTPLKTKQLIDSLGGDSIVLSADVVSGAAPLTVVFTLANAALTSGVTEVSFWDREGGWPLFRDEDDAQYVTDDGVANDWSSTFIFSDADATYRIVAKVAKNGNIYDIGPINITTDP